MAKNNTWWALVVLALPLFAHAEAMFGNDMAGDRKLPKTWGIGIDYFGMKHPYQIDSLNFSPPVLPITDPSILPIENEIRYADIKIDFWLTPFLNVFGIYGRIDGDTSIDLGVLGLPLPPEVNSLLVEYDGDVYGGGIVLVVGGDRWFASLTGTYTDTDLEGDFKSTVKATTLQPRVGVRIDEDIEFWLGGYIVDAEEQHTGTLTLDLGPLAGGPVDLDFGVDLSQEEDFNPSIGMHTAWADAWEATVEVGAGDRRTVLVNFTYRFE